MNDIVTIIDTHLAGYCEPDAGARARLLASSWSPDGELIDPPFDGAGHDGIAGLVDAVLSHFPGHVFRRSTAVDAHHDFARYGWELVAPDGSVPVSGVDFAQLAADGRLQRVVGFFGPLTPQTS